MTTEDRDRTPRNRMHVGGKLSFRGKQGGVPELSADEPAARWLLEGGEDPPALEDLVPDGFRQVEIEIGPGKGGYLAAAVAARPGTFLLGIEAARAYATVAARGLAEQSAENGRVLIDNGKLYLQDRVEDGALDRLHVYYPDPWPKRRHRGRRFFTEDVLRTLARVIADEGWLLVATDNAAYAGQICRVVGSCPWFQRDPQEEQRLLKMGPGHAFTPTNFEAKYIEQGRVLRRYAFRRRADG